MLTSIGLLLILGVGCRNSEPPPVAVPPGPSPEELQELRFKSLLKVADIAIPTGTVSGTFALSKDGEDMVVGGTDGSIWVLPLKTGTPHLLTAHSEPTRSAVFTPDGQTLITAGDDNRWISWNVSRERAVHQIRGHSRDIRALAVSPDGALLATGAEDSNVHLWRLRSAERLHVYSGHTKTVQAVIFAQDGQTLFSGGNDAQIRRWDLKTKKQMGGALSLGHRIKTLAWAPSTHHLLVAGGQGTLHWVDPNTWKVVFTRRHQSTASLRALHVSTDGLIATGNSKGRLTLWSNDPKNTEPHFGPIQAHEGGILALRFEPGGTLLSLGADGVVNRWNTDHGTPADTAPNLPPFNSVVRAVSAHPAQAHTVAAAGSRLFLFESNEAHVAPISRDLGEGGIASLTHVTPGNRLAVGRDTGEVWIQGCKRYECTEERVNVLEGSVRHLINNEAKEVLWVAGDSSKIVEVSTKDWATGRTLHDHRSRIVALAVDRTGQWLASTEKDYVTYIRDLNATESAPGENEQDPDPNRWRLRGHTISHLAFSPDSQLLATVQEQRLVTVYDIQTRTKFEDIRVHPRQVRALFFHPDGKVLISVDTLGNLKVFDAMLGTVLATGDAGRGKPSGLAIGNKGQSIITGGMDPNGSVKIFQFPEKP